MFRVDMIVGWGWVRLESEDVEQEEAGRHHEHGGDGGRGGRADHQHLPDPGGADLCVSQESVHKVSPKMGLSKCWWTHGAPAQSTEAGTPLKRFSKYYSWWDFGFLDTRHRDI